MREPKIYDAIIVITPSDLNRVRGLLHYAKKYMPVRNLIFVGAEGVGEIIDELNDDKLKFINENSIIRFDDIRSTLEKKLNENDVPRGIIGWYYQQFLKMGYSSICEDEYYMVWDGDTIPCGDFSMFKEGTETPYLDVKNEYNEEYFITMNKLLPGFRKIIEKSFISEHMLIKCDIMQGLINTIENNNDIEGTKFYEKIINAVRPEMVKSSSFSEFETYGTFAALTNSSSYMLRDWHSLRFGSFFFEPDIINDDDLEWLRLDFEAISFEKDEEYQPEYAEFFHNQEYREKLRPRQIVEAIWDQGAIKSNVVEKWD